MAGLFQRMFGSEKGAAQEKRAGELLGGVAKLSENPMIRAVVGVLPFGGSVLTGIDVGKQVIDAAQPGFLKRPSFGALDPFLSMGGAIASSKTFGLAVPQQKQLGSGIMEAAQTAGGLASMFGLGANSGGGASPTMNQIQQSAFAAIGTGFPSVQTAGGLASMFGRGTGQGTPASSAMNALQQGTFGALGIGTPLATQARTAQAAHLQNQVAKEMTMRNFMPGRRPANVTPQLQELLAMKSQVDQLIAAAQAPNYSMADNIPVS